jgi:hypothetical protein
MHILDYLKKAGDNVQVGEDSVVRFEYRLDENSVRVEYRLICSGMFYPGHFLGDWGHSDGARILLSLPVELLVASRPYDDYPQELVLRFVAPLVSETEGRIPHSYHPDLELASDVAALLTLLCRRLVTVSAKVREQYDSTHVPPILADYPIPAVTTVRMSYWKARPLAFLYGPEGVKVKSYHPPPLPFDSAEIIQALLALPKLKVASAVVRAARLYASAMERIESQPELCYQLFISAAETMAGAVLEDWEPDRDGKLASKGALVSYATKTEKLSKDVAERLALEASKGNPWSSRKFKKFLLDNLDREAICREDDLLIVPQEFCPKEEQLEQALGEIYRSRSGASPSGHSYPAGAAIGPSLSLPVKAFAAVINQQRPFPPVGWFERVVNSAICGFLRSQVRRLPSLNAKQGRESTVVQRQEAEATPPPEDWFQHLQRIRAEREAAGYPFMNEEEANAHIEWLREGDRIDDLLREADEQRQKPGQPEC